MRFCVLVLEPWEVSFAVAFNQGVTPSEWRVANYDVETCSRPQSVVEQEYFRKLDMPVKWHHGLLRGLEQNPVTLDIGRCVLVVLIDELLQFLDQP